MSGQLDAAYRSSKMSCDIIAINDQYHKVDVAQAAALCLGLKPQDFRAKVSVLRFTASCSAE